MWKNYISVWAIITLALIIFVTVSFCDAEKLMGEGFRKATFPEHLTASIEESEVQEPSEAVTEAPEAEPSAPAPVDTASQNILIIGDSMLEGLNPRLAAYAKANGHKLNSVIWYSSQSEYWGTCDTLKVFLRRFKPTFIFISLGGNELFVRDIEKKRDKYVKNFLAQIGDIPYLWIGPPNWKPDTGINDLIAKNVKPGCFFLSNGMHFDRAKDGAHPTHASAALWMDSIARWMPEHAAHPIRMTKPADGMKARPSEVIVLQPKR